MPDNDNGAFVPRALGAGENPWGPATQGAASAALTGVQAVPPAAAASATEAEHVTGIPAAVGMYSPEVGQAKQKVADQQAALANPSVASWVAGAPPQHVAAVQDDLSALSRVSMTLDQYKAQGGPIGDVVSAYKSLMGNLDQIQAKSDVASATGDIGGWWKAQGAYAWTALNGALGLPLAPIGNVIGQGLSQIAPPAGDYAKFVPSHFDAASGRMVPSATTPANISPEERAQGWLGVGNLLTAAALSIPEVEGAGPAAAVERGRGAPAPEPEPTPYAGPQRLLPNPSVGVNPEFDVVRTQMAAHDAQEVATVQQEIAQSGLQDKAPAALIHFLDEQAPGTVSVDADKLAELAQQGHEPFPELQDEIRLAAIEGRDVKVPTGRYLAATSGQPFAEELNQATTFRDGGVAAQDEVKPPEAVELPKLDNTYFPGMSPDETVRAKTIAEVNLAETKAVFQSQFLAPLFKDAKALGMTGDQMGRFSSGLEDIQRTAHENAIQAAVKQVKAERGPEFKEAAARHAKEWRARIESVPAVRAMKQLGQTGFKLDRDLVENFHPGLAGRLPDSIMRKGGNHPAVAADLNGYIDSGQMLSELADLHDEVKAGGAKDLQDHINKLAKALGKDAAAEELGYSLAPEELRTRAMEAVPQEAITRFLSDELQALGKAEGFPLDLQQLKEDARQGFGRQLAKDAINTKKTERDVYRSGERALRAMQKGDTALAFRWRQIQFYRRLQLLDSFKFQKEYAGYDKALTRWSRGKYGGDANFGAVLENLAWEMGYSPTRDTGELQRYLANAPLRSTADAVLAVQGAGVPLDNATIPPMLRAQSNGKVLPNLPVAMLRDFMNMAEGLAKFGRELSQVELAGQRAELDYIGNSVQAQADSLIRKFTMNDLTKERNSVFLRTKDTLQSILVNNLRPETFLHWMDGEKWGPLMDSVVKPLQEGKHTERALTDAWVTAIRGVGEDYYKTMRQEVEVPPFMRSQVNSGNPSVIRNRGDVRTALLHLGSESARTKLLEGYGWGGVQERWLLDQATDADKRFLRTFWDENEKLFDLADKMYGRVRGYGLEADPARTVTFSDGSTLKGGHIHIQYEQHLLDNARIQPDAPKAAMDLDGADLLGLHPASALPSAFYGIKRTGFVGPIALDYHNLSSGVSQTIHDIAFREALVQAQKVLTDPRVRDALRTTLGPEYEKQMMPWLRYIAQQRIVMDQSTVGLSNMVRTMSNNFTWAEIAYNLGSFVKHSGIGMVHAGITAKGDVAGFSQALFDTLGPGAKQAGWRQFIATQMPEVGQLEHSFESSLSDAIDAEALGNNRYKQLGYFMMGMSKRVEARATALSTYRREIAIHGQHFQAVAVAEKAVRDSQGVGHPVDSPALGRHTGTALGEAGRMAYGLLMSFRGASFNYLWRAQQQMELAARLAQAGRGPEAVEAAKRGIGIGATLILGSAAVTALYATVVAGRRDRDAKGRPKGLAQSAAQEFAWGVGDATAGNLMVLAPIMEALHYGEANSPTATMAKEGSAVWRDLNAALGNGKPADQHPILDAMALAGQITGLIPVEAAHAAQATSDQLNPAARLQSGEREPLPFAQRALLNRSPAYVPTTRRRTRR